jgi:hypothetical protein
MKVLVLYREDFATQGVMQWGDLLEALGIPDKRDEDLDCDVPLSEQYHTVSFFVTEPTAI